MEGGGWGGVLSGVDGEGKPETIDRLRTFKGTGDGGVRAGGELLWRFRKSTNDNDHNDRTRI